MDDAKRYIRDIESFHRRYGLIRRDPPPSRLQRAKHWLSKLLRRTPEPPADPHAYVMAGVKPRPPYLRGSATAD